MKAPPTLMEILRRPQFISLDILYKRTLEFPLAFEYYSHFSEENKTQKEEKLRGTTVSSEIKLFVRYIRDNFSYMVQKCQFHSQS